MNVSTLRNRVVPFKFAPFSTKQIKVLTWWGENSPYKDYNTIIADGSVRSGKTVSLALSFVMWAMETFNGCNLALCGKTIHATRRNVVNPLKQMLKSRHYNVLDIRGENVLFISKRYKSKDGKVHETINQFHIFGGSDESSQDLIQGITLAGVFFDECALMPESFVNQATARCSVEGAKFWFSCNPSDPFHWFKMNWINKIEEKKALYLHFTMDDNPSLSKEVKERYKSLYTGVFYKRYILGLWVMADGVVYPMFDEDKHCIEYDRYFTRYFIAADFGIQNATTWGLYGYYAPEKHYHLIDRYYHSGKDARKQFNRSSAALNNAPQQTTKEYVTDLKDFIDNAQVLPEYIAIDPSAAALIVEIRKDPYFKRRKIKVIPAKNNVMIGIQFMSFMLNTGNFTLYPDCTYDKEEFFSYCWNEDRVEKGVDEVLKVNDHCMDSNRYALYTDSVLHRTYSKQIQQLSGKGALI